MCFVSSIVFAHAPYVQQDVSTLCLRSHLLTRCSLLTRRAQCVVLCPQLTSTSRVFGHILHRDHFRTITESPPPPPHHTTHTHTHTHTHIHTPRYRYRCRDFAAAAVNPRYAPILSEYYNAIGQPTTLPSWAMGFWASKQRYASQTEILDTVRNYRAHNITVDVLVIDWKHYECVGDWNFTPNPAVCWPSPADMVSTLRSLGVKQVFVSLHPSVTPCLLSQCVQTAM